MEHSKPIELSQERSMDVANLVKDNILYLTEKKALKASEYRFLMHLILIAKPSNQIEFETISEVAKNTRISEKRTRQLIGSLLKKSILLEGILLKGIYIHPEICVIGNPERVSLTLVEEVIRIRKRLDHQGVIWPLVLIPGKHRGLWRERLELKC